MTTIHNPEFETFFKESLTNSNTITPIMIDIESKVGILEPKTNYSIMPYMFGKGFLKIPFPQIFIFD